MAGITPNWSANLTPIHTSQLTTTEPRVLFQNRIRQLKEAHASKSSRKMVKYSQETKLTSWSSPKAETLLRRQTLRGICQKITLIIRATNTTLCSTKEEPTLLNQGASRPQRDQIHIQSTKLSEGTCNPHLKLRDSMKISSMRIKIVKRMPNRSQSRTSSWWVAMSLKWTSIGLTLMLPRVENQCRR